MCQHALRSTCSFLVNNALQLLPRVLPAMSNRMCSHWLSPVLLLLASATRAHCARCFVFLPGRTVPL